MSGLIQDVRYATRGLRKSPERVSADIAQPRFTTIVLVGFSAAALLLAAIGLFGVIAYNVGQRTREIGIRLALGAEQSDVQRLVLRRGLTLTAVGLVAGIASSLAAGHLMSGLLFGVAAADIPTLTVVALILIAIGVLASYLPARRAARVDPLVALRYE